jgi:uncharacterized protein
MNIQPLSNECCEPYGMHHQKMLSIIQDKVATEFIYLLGTCFHQHRTESLFIASSEDMIAPGHFYLLVLVDEKEYSLDPLQDKIENNLLNFIPATAIVLNVHSFNNWLLKGHPFASLVVQKATLLYNAGNVHLNDPAETDPEQVRKEKESLYNHTKIFVEEFFAGAELFALRKQYKLAAFMLHQAAEQALRALLFISAGLRINTHSIDKLLRYCAMCCSQLLLIFPRRHEKEKQIFRRLQDAYIDSRYKEDYSIGYEDLKLIEGKVREIQRLFLGADSEAGE